MSEITIGCVVVDLTSGLEGTVTAKSELFNGNVQYNVQPKALKGADKLPEQWSMDARTLKFKSKGISELAVKAQHTEINIGDEVVDIISAHKGIASAKTTFLNGCVYFDVVKPANESKKTESTSMFLSCVRLQRVGKKSLKPLVAKDEQPTGGPTTRAMRAC